MGIRIGPALAWGTAILLLFVPVDATRTGLPLPPWLLFAWLCMVILWTAFAAVREATALSRMVREPYGSLILTLAVSLIEVVLVGAAMLVAPDGPTLARDTMFSVLMIVLNGVVGLGLLIGGIRHHEQTFNLQGASAYLSLMIPLATIVLVLPSYSTATQDGYLTVAQSICFSLMTLFLYGLFLWLQTGRHRGYFVDAPPEPEGDEAGVAPPPRPSRRAIVRGSGRLVACIAPISLLATPLAVLLDRGLETLGVPLAVGGVAIAILVFAPEGMSTLIAFSGNKLTKGFNVSMGAAASTLGITVPAVLLISLYTGQKVILGLPPDGIALLAATLLLSTITFSARTTMLAGAVHLSLFVAFLVLAFEA